MKRTGDFTFPEGLAKALRLRSSLSSVFVVPVVFVACL